MSGATPADKPPEPSAAAGKATGKQKTKTKKVRMTQEEIESLMRYQTVHMPVDALPRVSKEFLALAAQHDQSHLTVPLDQMDDYIADILRNINRMEAKFMKQRARILNDYHTKGYAYFDEEGDGDDDQGVVAAPPPPPPGGLALAAQHDQSHLTVPLDQLDNYIADILRNISRMDAKCMKQRERILNDYHTKGYAYFDEEGDDDDQGVAASPPPPPAGGRRRSRPGVVKQKGGQTKRLN